MSAPPMINHSRRETLTTSAGPSLKRKERDGFLNVLKPSPLTTKRLAKPSPLHRPPTPAPIRQPPQPPPLSNNQLLAGYLAHEFLSKGTLLGQPFDPARAEAVPVSSATTGSRLKPGSYSNYNNNKQKGIAESGMGKQPQPPPPPPPDKEKHQIENYQRYMEVADLLKTDGAHLPGIVNPTQLARFLQLG